MQTRSLERGQNAVPACENPPMRMPRRAHQWFVLIWLAVTLVGAVALAITRADEDSDPGNGILFAILVVFISCGLLGALAWDFVRHRKDSGYPPGFYGLWDFIKDTWSEGD